MAIARPAATRERVFSENFIRHQYVLIENASRTVIRHGLLEEHTIQIIFNHMRLLFVKTVPPYTMIEEGEGDTIGYAGLLKFINDTITKLKKNYKAAGYHPLIPHLKVMQTNIEKYVQITQPQFKDASNKNTAEHFNLEMNAHHPKVDAFERVFSDNFISVEYNRFIHASQTITSDGILEEEAINDIISYMKDLHANTHGSVTVKGQQNSSRTYDGLLQLLNNTVQELTANYRWTGSSPLAVAIAEIHSNVRQYLSVAQPQFASFLRDNHNDMVSNEMSARCEIAKDTCGILLCLGWIVPQKVMTLDNGCETICGPSESICPESSLPKNADNGKVYWNIFAPKNSIKALCDDIREQSQQIDELKKNPLRQVMQ